jgi:hypothetical protein
MLPLSCTALRTAAAAPALTETVVAGSDVPDVAAPCVGLPAADPLADTCDDGAVAPTLPTLVP